MGGELQAVLWHNKATQQRHAVEGKPVSVDVRGAAHQHHKAHAHQEPDDLGHGLARREALLQLRNQIGQGHIDKAAGGHGQKVRQPVVQLPHQKIPHQPAQGRVTVNTPLAAVLTTCVT